MIERPSCLTEEEWSSINYFFHERSLERMIGWADMLKRLRDEGHVLAYAYDNYKNAEKVLESLLDRGY